MAYRAGTLGHPFRELIEELRDGRHKADDCTFPPLSKA
jgi:hypothetical protein